MSLYFNSQRPSRLAECGLEFVLNQPDHGKFVEFLKEQYGTVLSPEEIEDVAVSFQVQLQERLERKISSRRSA